MTSGPTIERGEKSGQAGERSAKRQDSEKYGMAENNGTASGTAASRAIASVQSSVVGLQSSVSQRVKQFVGHVSLLFYDELIPANCFSNACSKLHSARRLQQHHVAFASLASQPLARFFRRGHEFGSAFPRLLAASTIVLAPGPARRCRISISFSAMSRPQSRCSSSPAGPSSSISPATTMRRFAGMSASASTIASGPLDWNCSNR